MAANPPTLTSEVERLKAAYDAAPNFHEDIKAFLAMYRLALRMAKKLDRGR